MQNTVECSGGGDSDADRPGWGNKVFPSSSLTTDIDTFYNGHIIHHKQSYNFNILLSYKVHNTQS